MCCEIFNEIKIVFESNTNLMTIKNVLNMGLLTPPRLRNDSLVYRLLLVIVRNINII